jgi:broad specificity phosphatase PhoE
MTKYMNLPTIYLARHAETIFNRAGRLQGQIGHSPLTLTGVGQAQAMGEALKAELGRSPDVALWCSSAGRTRQTLSIACEVLDLNYMDAQADDRLQEIHVGAWEGRYYQEIIAEHGPIMDPDWRLFSKVPPEGEWYDGIEARMADWLGTIAGSSKPCIVISHGISARVLRGLLVGGTAYHGVLIAPDAPQGTVFRIAEGAESVLHTGSGSRGEDRLRSV